MNSQTTDCAQQTAVSGLLLPPDVAKFLNVSESCLAKWRCSGGGPIFLKIGNRIRYRRSDVEAYLDRAARASTSDAAA